MNINVIFLLVFAMGMLFYMNKHRHVSFVNILNMRVVFLSVLVFMLGTGNVFANTSGEKITVSIPKWQSAKKEYKCAVDPNASGVSESERVSKDVTLIAVSATGSTITYNKSNFNKCLSSSRKDAVKNFVADLQSSGLDEQVQQSVIDTLSQSDRNISRLLIPAVMDSVSADLFGAGKAIKPFVDPMNLLIGIIVYIVMFLIILSTTLDLAYIGIPIFRDSADNRSNDKGKIPFISSDAISVVKESEGGSGSSGGYKNPYITYFKRRFITYVVLAVCILYLVLGEISGLITWLLSLGEGLFN